MRRPTTAAVMALTCIALAGPAHSAVPEADATELMTEGKALYDEGRLEDALKKFERALELTGSPNARLVVARCLKDLRRNAEAYRQLSRAVKDAAALADSDERYKKTRDAAASLLALVDPLVGKLIIVVVGTSEAATVTLDGERVAPDDLRVPIPVEPHEVVLRAEGAKGKSVEHKVEVLAGRATTVTLDLRDSDASAPAATAGPATTATTAPPPEPEPEPDGPSWFGPVRIAGVVVGVVAIGAGVLYGVMGSMAQDRYDTLEAHCGDGPCDASYQDTIDEGQLYMVLADVGFGVGVAALASSVLMLALGGPEDGPEPVVGLHVSADGAVAGARWQF